MKISCGARFPRGARPCAMPCRRWISRPRGSIRGCGPRTSPPPTTSGSVPSLDELDLVAVRVFDECNDARAALHRPRLARHLAALGAHAVAGLAYVVHLDRDMAVGRAVLRPVADEGEGILLLRAVGRAQELHAEHLGVERDRALHIADAQHGVQ